MLKLQNLKAETGDFRLGGINLSVGAGSCHAVLGPSGSGKSTLLNAVLGVLPVTGGSIQLNADDITSLPMERRRLGYVPQHLGLFPHMSVKDNLAYSARARRVPKNEFEPLLHRLVSLTGIDHLLERRPPTLSGGERQRVALVRALAANPRMVLLDEPFTALNESLRRELWWLVKELQRRRDLSVLLITHDLTEAYFLADDITVLIDGRQEQSDAKAKVYQWPASLAVARFLGIKNLYHAKVLHASAPGIVADCPILQTRFHLKGEAHPGTAIRIGIRAENVSLRDKDHPPHPGECILSGTARLIDLGAEVIIRFRQREGEAVVELSASWRTVRRFGLTEKRGDVTIGLPEASLFWVYDD